MLACGNNEFNKLGLNQGITGLKNHPGEVLGYQRLLFFIVTQRPFSHVACRVGGSDTITSITMFYPRLEVV